MAVVWHYWIGAALALAGVLLVIATAVGYFQKVERPRYPKSR
jgi:hypothetical protein